MTHRAPQLSHFPSATSRPSALPACKTEQPSHIIAALVEALESPTKYRLAERNGELFIEIRADSGSPRSWC